MAEIKRFKNKDAGHCMRAAYSTTSRVITAVLARILNSSVSVCSFPAVTKAFATHNLNAEDQLSRGYLPHCEVWKLDLDNFFNNVPRALIWASWTKLKELFKQEVGNRRLHVVIPLKSWRKSDGRLPSFTRSFGMTLNMAASQKDPVRYQNSHQHNSFMNDVTHVDFLPPSPKA